MQSPNNPEKGKCVGIHTLGFCRSSLSFFSSLRGGASRRGLFERGERGIFGEFAKFADACASAFRYNVQLNQKVNPFSFSLIKLT